MQKGLEVGIAGESSFLSLGSTGEAVRREKMLQRMTQLPLLNTGEMRGGRDLGSLRVEPYVLVLSFAYIQKMPRVQVNFYRCSLLCTHLLDKNIKYFSISAGSLIPLPGKVAVIITSFTLEQFSCS